VSGIEQPVYRITDLHEAEHACERLPALGPQALSKAKGIAIWLRVGVPGENAVQVGRPLLPSFGGPCGLPRAPLDVPVSQRGAGDAAAAHIRAAIELERSRTLESVEAQPTINNPADAAALLQHEMSASEQEHLRVLLAERRNPALDLTEFERGEQLAGSSLRSLQSRDPAQRQRVDHGTSSSASTRLPAPATWR